MTKENEIKDFSIDLPYNETVEFLDKEGYRLLTVDEWSVHIKQFPEKWCWLQKLSGDVWPVGRGNDDYYFNLNAVDGIDDRASRGVVGVKNEVRS
jgi:hypothetical protein